MGSVNKAILVGNLGRDAELKWTNGGTPVASLSLATTEKFKDRDGNQREDTQWHRVILWGKTAEALHEYLTKGKSIYVEGKIQTREFEKDGQKQRITEVKADRVVLLGGTNGSGGSRGDREREQPSRAASSRRDGAAPTRGSGRPAYDDVPDDDIPF